MAVYIYEPDALDKMVRVESKDYWRWSFYFGKVSFYALYRAWLEWAKDCSEWRAFRPKFIINAGRYDSMIYGSGGWNRYYVLSDGEIMFAKNFASYCETEPETRGVFVNEDAVCEAVRRVGFRIFPDDLKKE